VDSRLALETRVTSACSPMLRSPGTLIRCLIGYFPFAWAISPQTMSAYLCGLSQIWSGIQIRCSGRRPFEGPVVKGPETNGTVEGGGDLVARWVHADETDVREELRSIRGSTLGHLPLPPPTHTCHTDRSCVPGHLGVGSSRSRAGRTRPITSSTSRPSSRIRANAASRVSSSSRTSISPCIRFTDSASAAISNTSSSASKRAAVLRAYTALTPDPDSCAERRIFLRYSAG